MKSWHEVETAMRRQDEKREQLAAAYLDQLINNTGQALLEALAAIEVGRDAVVPMDLVEVVDRNIKALRDDPWAEGGTILAGHAALMDAASRKLLELAMTTDRPKEAAALLKEHREMIKLLGSTVNNLAQLRAPLKVLK